VTGTRLVHRAYRRTLAAHREAVPPRRVDQGIAEAVGRQTAAMRELSRRAFPEPDVVPDDAPAPIEVGRVPQRLRFGLLSALGTAAPPRNCNRTAEAPVAGWSGRQVPPVLPRPEPWPCPCVRSSV
jgi:hypothetical protein